MKTTEREPCLRTCFEAESCLMARGTMMMNETLVLVNVNFGIFDKVKVHGLFSAMKKLFVLVCVMVLVGGLVAGCHALLTSTPAPSALVVTMGGATTNDANLVAYLKAATLANASLNPTPTQAPVNTILISLTALVAAAAGWYTKHVSATAAAVAAAAAAATATAAASAAAAQSLALVKPAAQLPVYPPGSPAAASLAAMMAAAKI